MKKPTKIIIKDLETGNWEVGILRDELYNEYPKHPLITFVMEYESVTEQQAYNDALANINAVIEAAELEKKALLSKNPVLMTNLKHGGEVRKVEKL